MTPLFHAIANETTKPLKDRRLVDPAGIAQRLGECHFFDVSAVLDMADDLGSRIIAADSVNGRLAFLPAQLTAIEFGRNNTGRRVGVILEEIDTFCRCTAVGESAEGYSFGAPFYFGLHDNAALCAVAPESALYRGMLDAFAGKIYGLLAMINTPRVVGRKQHLPHAGLQRKLAAARGMVGKFPLRGWTEIVLEVTPPRVEGEQVHETRLTGQKCKHYCRTHLRIWNGYLTLVKGHWRGDPALGIKQTRYRLAA